MKSKILLLSTVFLLIPSTGFSSSTIIFSGAELESGTANSVNAVYRFSNALTITSSFASQNFDALVTIRSISANTQLIDFDDDSGINGGNITAESLFSPRVQTLSPTVDISVAGSVVFDFLFVESGGDAANSVTLLGLGLSSLDTDGTGAGANEIREFVDSDGSFSSFGSGLSSQTGGLDDTDNGISDDVFLISTDAVANNGINDNAENLSVIDLDAAGSGRTGFTLLAGVESAETTASGATSRRFAFDFSESDAVSTAPTPSPVPEPSVTLLAFLGFAVALGRRHRS